MTDTPNDLAWRNLLRARILEIADGLDTRTMTAAEGASELRRLSDADITEMDESDIEIDFDTGSDAASILMALSGNASRRSVPADPVEDALSKVIKLRDRNNGLRIISDEPGVSDIDAYRNGLEELRLVLNAAPRTTSGKA